MLASGPYLHFHDANQLGVVNAATGETYKIGNLSITLSDISFNRDGKLYGISAERLYEINPGTAALTDLGTHGISGANGMVFRSDGRLLVMARSSPKLYTISDVTRPAQSTSLTLPSLEATEGSNGDLSMLGADLIVAATNGSLMRYRFDVDPNRPRLISETPLSRTDIAGLAAVGSDALFGMSDNSVITFNLGGGAPVQRDITLPTNPAFGDVRGTAYYEEAGGPLPVGTLAGIKWRDDNADGTRQASEPLLEDWDMYVDRNLNGIFDTGEPKGRTNAQGQYVLFGNAPGLHTVDEIVADTTNYIRTAPRTSNRHLVADYDFEDSTAKNQVGHLFGLPTLLSSQVTFNGDDVRLNSPTSFLELPTEIGRTPMTILLDGTFQPSQTNAEYLISQRLNEAATNHDFALFHAAGSPTLQSNFCNQSDSCVSASGGTLDAQRHQIALVWDGRNVGIFTDNSLVTRTVGTTGVPDIDGTLLRFGKPVTTATSGITGSFHGIRIFNRALTETELRNGFSTTKVATAYSVFLPDATYLDQLNFGNQDRRIQFNPEIEVRRDSANGQILVSSGPTIDLGSVPTSGPAPQITFAVKNIGQSTLQVPNVQVPTGYQLLGQSNGGLITNQVMTFTIRLTDLTPGSKTGQVRIENNDADENPFVINLTAEVGAADFNGSPALALDATGNIWQLNEDGTSFTVATGLPTSLRDIAQHPTQNSLYAIDATHIYQITLGNTPASSTATKLFAHGITNPTALGFSNTNQLFAAGTQIFRINIAEGTKTSFGSLGVNQAGDYVTFGGQNYIATESGLLYRMSTPAPVSLGIMTPTFTGLAAVSSTTVLGFTSNRAYLVDLATRATTASYILPTTTILGATTRFSLDGHNGALPMDVNADNAIAPMDALLIINELNNRQFTDETGLIIKAPTAPTRYPDVNNDGFVSPGDAITIINYLNAQAEGEATPDIATSKMDVSEQTASTSNAIDWAIASLWANDDERRKEWPTET